MQLFLVPLLVLERQQVAGDSRAPLTTCGIFSALRFVSERPKLLALTVLDGAEDTRTKQPRMRIYFHWVKEASTLTVTPGLCRGNNEREYQDIAIKRP
jgi:hypothetical protein